MSVKKSHFGSRTWRGGANALSGNNNALERAYDVAIARRGQPLQLQSTELHKCFGKWMRRCLLGGTNHGEHRTRSHHLTIRALEITHALMIAIVLFLIGPYEGDEVCHDHPPCSQGTRLVETNDIDLRRVLKCRPSLE